MKFKTKTGIELEFDLERWIKPENYSTKIVDETLKNYELLTSSNMIVKIPKRDIEMHGIEVKSDEMILNKHLYVQYVDKLIRKKEAKANKAIKKSFEKIIKHKELVLNKAEYFLIEPSMFLSGAMPITAFGCCLGSVLESWESSEELVIKDYEGHKELYLYSVIGDYNKRKYISTLWSFEKNESVELTELPEKTFKEWFETMQNVRDRYRFDFIFNMQYKAMYKLLVEIQGMEKE